jgi:hypothetical protein
VHYLPNDTSARNSALISAIAEHPTPIRAELSSDRRCSAAGTTVNAYAPVLAIARKLIAAGHNPDCVLEAYRGSTLCLRAKLGAAARLEVKDNRGRPLFVPWRARSVRAVAPPIAPNGRVLPRQPSDEKNAFLTEAAE